MVNHSHYFSLSSMLLIRTSSHICGRWYLPVSVQGCIIDPYEQWFFDQPGEVLLFPAHYTEVVQSAGMACGVTVVIYRGGGF